MLKFLINGDTAVTAELGTKIDPEISRDVFALDRAIADASIAGLVAAVPTYRSVTLHYDPMVIRRGDLIRAVEACWEKRKSSSIRRRRWTVPVAYGGEMGADLGLVASLHGISEEEVVRRHAEPRYSVSMIGFAPGFAYLAGLDASLETSRRQEPRRAIPPSSVSIGGIQTAFSPPLSLPSGWQLIGRAPIRSFDLSRDPPFLFEAGDEIRFAATSHAEFEALDSRAAAGERIAVLEDVA